MPRTGPIPVTTLKPWPSSPRLWPKSRQTQISQPLLPLVAAAPAARLTGARLSPGLAIGVAALRDPPLPIQRMVAEDESEELRRLAQGVDRMRNELDTLLDDPSLDHAGEHRDILDAFRLAASDDGWIRRIRAGIANGMTAEVAARRAQTEARIRMRRAQSAYLRDRLADMDDLAGRLVRAIAAQSGDDGMHALPPNAILFAHALGPAEVLELDRGCAGGAGAGRRVSVLPMWPSSPGR